MIGFAAQSENFAHFGLVNVKPFANSRQFFGRKPIRVFGNSRINFARGLE